MDYMSEYKRWLESPALSDEERAELKSVEGNNEEIESRFFAPLSFGTAGLRGVLAVGEPDRLQRQGRDGPRRCHCVR